MRLPHPILVVAAVFGTLSGCSDYRHAERPAWRNQAEEVCLAKGLVTESEWVRPFHEVSGPGICGAVHPFKVTALDGGTVTLNSPQTLDCPMIAALDAWVREVVQPAAEARFGERVARIDSMGSYNCRGINNVSGAGLSEHSFANAIDVGGFVLASGRTLSVMKGFNGRDEQERAFLHEAHAGACGHFTTVLGPGYNIFHYNHFHMDLAMHGGTSRGPRRYCKPVPQPNLPEPPVKDNLPDPPAIEEEMDIARAPLPEPSYRSGPPALVASLPPAPLLRPEVPAYAPRPAAVALAPPEPAPSSRGHAARPVPVEEPLISFGGTVEDAPPLARQKRRPAADETATLDESGAVPAPPPRRLHPAPAARDPGAAPVATALAPANGAPEDWDLASATGR